MSTAAGTYTASKEVAAALPSAMVNDCAMVNDSEPKHHIGLEGESDKQREGDGTKQDAGFQFYYLRGRFDKLKDNQSPNRWKEQILGKSDVSAVGSQGVNRETEVKILSISIQSSGLPDIVLPIHDLVSVNSRRNILFSLNEGSSCHTRFTFLVSNGTVPSLKHTYTVWKAVHSTNILIGSFDPREEAYTHDLPEETIPCGIFVRGSYFVRTKFVDEEGKCYMDFSYYFEIRKKGQ